jgi:alkylation response protein AidB-like acyl-CoA dehydrogenase
MTFQERLAQFKQSVENIFRTPEHVTAARGISAEAFEKIMQPAPLAAFIPDQYGGHGNDTANALQILEAAGYESLPLSLMLGINGALFIQPVARYASEPLKHDLFDKFIREKRMGGLMITEPDYGSDALRMQTSYQEHGDYYNVTGTKHWGGLTGRADFWLLTARKRNERGELARDVDFFVHDNRKDGIKVEEYYANLGLYLITYGRNKINADIPKEQRLMPESSGVKMMLDLLHRSRSQFPGMGVGYIRRLLDEAMTHCRERIVGGSSLITYDQVKRRLNEMQAAYTITSAMCYFTAKTASIRESMADRDVTANSIKTVVTDFMQETAQHLLQLVGAKGYSYDHIAGRSVVDSRPFQIFEGSNDILYQQISDSVIKMMRKMKEINLYQFFSQYEFSSRAAEYLKDALNVNIDTTVAQHKMVELGKAISKIISLEMVLRFSEKNFNRELIRNAVQTLVADIQSMMFNYNVHRPALVSEYYNENSSWSLA